MIKLCGTAFRLDLKRLCLLLISLGEMRRLDLPVSDFLHRQIEEREASLSLSTG